MAINDRWLTREKARTAEYGCKERWQVRWRDQQGRQRKKSFARKLDAEAFDAEIKTQLRKGTYVDPAAGQVTFRVYAEEWRKNRPHDPSTAERIEAEFRVRAYPALGAYPIGTLAQRPSSLLQPWIKGLTAELHPNTVRKIILDVAQVFAAAVADGIIPANPLAKLRTNPAIDAPKAVKTEAVPWSAAQVVAVARELPPHLAALPWLAAACGPRQGEAFGLALDDVDFLRRTLHVGTQVKIVAGQLVYADTKNGKVRDIPIAGQVLPVLAEHVRQHPPAEVTLPWGSPDGKPVTRKLLFTWRGREAISRGNFNPAWKRAWRAAGIPDRGRLNGFHVTRHTAASSWLSAGLSPAKVAAFLGDTVAVVWATYAHFMPGDDDRARAIMEQFFAGAETVPSAPDVPWAAR